MRVSMSRLLRSQGAHMSNRVTTPKRTGAFLLVRVSWADELPPTHHHHHHPGQETRFGGCSVLFVLKKQAAAAVMLSQKQIGGLGNTARSSVGDALQPQFSPARRTSHPKRRRPYGRRPGLSRPTAAAIGIWAGTYPFPRTPRPAPRPPNTGCCFT